MASKDKPYVVFLPAGMNIKHTAEGSLHHEPRAPRAKKKNKSNTMYDKSGFNNRVHVNMNANKEPELLWGDKIKPRLQTDNLPQAGSTYKQAPLTICKRNNKLPEIFSSTGNMGIGAGTQPSTSRSNYCDERTRRLPPYKNGFSRMQNTKPDSEWGEIDQQVYKTAGPKVPLIGVNQNGAINKSRQIIPAPKNKVRSFSSDQNGFPHKQNTEHPDSEWGEVDKQVYKTATPKVSLNGVNQNGVINKSKPIIPVPKDNVHSFSSDESDWGESEDETDKVLGSSASKNVQSSVSSASSIYKNVILPEVKNIPESDSSDWGETDDEDTATAIVRTKFEIKKTEKEKCKCENCDEYVHCTSWCNRNVMFDGSSGTDRKGLPLFRNDELEKIESIPRQYNNNIVIHGSFIPKPIKSLEDSSFPETIKKGLRETNGASIKNLQSYVWTPILRSLNLFMIGTTDCEISLTYLPAFCSFALEKNGRYAELAQFEGPLVLILCSDEKNCEKVRQFIQDLLSTLADQVTVEVLIDTPAKKFCDILVTTPSVLDRNLKSEAIKLRRLCHVALEDTYLLLQNHAKEMEKILKVIQSVQANRPHNKNLQLVVCSEKFTPDILNLMKHMYSIPLVYFEDFAEAALYSKIKFQKKKLYSAHKIFYLDDILKRDYANYKVVVFCNDSEIGAIKNHCEFKGIECISLTNDLDEDELTANEKMWCSLKPGRSKVLLCSDELFEKTKITNANQIVHFSPPLGWGQFQKRFRCLSQNLCSPFDASPINLISYLLIDETPKCDFYSNFYDVLRRISIENFKFN